MASWQLYIIDDLGEHCQTCHPDFPATSEADVNTDLEVTSLHEIHVEKIVRSYEHFDYAIIYENAFRKHAVKKLSGLLVPVQTSSPAGTQNFPP
jgi:hypothetical protein